MKKSFYEILTIVLLFFFSACGKDDENKAPSCNIIHPSENMQITQGETINISVEANDSDGTVSEVRIAIDGIGVGSVNNYPYNFELNTTDLTLGKHRIKATSIDNEGGNKADEVFIQILEGSNEIPIANFKADTLTGPAPFTVTFTDLSLNKPTNWLWTFGDNSTSNIQNPTRTFNSLGNYDVTLTVANKNGSDTKIKTNYIIVSDYPPVADFSVSPQNGLTTDTFVFDASSSYDYENSSDELVVRWDFDGDGQWDSDWKNSKIESYKFSYPDTFVAKLEVKDKKEQISLVTKSIEVNSNNTPPTANFTYSNGSGIAEIAFDASSSFDNEQSVSDLEIRWDFDGDGIWETDWRIVKTVDYVYHFDGMVSVNLEVKDSEGLTSSYSSNVDVTVGNSSFFIDPRDGQSYATIELLDQTWFAENLNYEMEDSKCYNNSSSNCGIYGRLYTWDAAMNACPIGWHIPSDDEWKSLEIALGMSQNEVNSSFWRGTIEGKKLKLNNGWNNNGNGYYGSGFNAIPSGWGDENGAFDGLGDELAWWSSTEKVGNTTVYVWYRGLAYNTEQIKRFYLNKTYYYSVRCIKD